MWTQPSRGPTWRTGVSCPETPSPSGGGSPSPWAGQRQPSRHSRTTCERLRAPDSCSRSWDVRCTSSATPSASAVSRSAGSCFARSPSRASPRSIACCGGSPDLGWWRSCSRSRSSCSATRCAWAFPAIALLVAWQAAAVTPLRAAIARRAGHVASIALLVATGSGALLTFQHLTGTGDLTDTSYGRLIVAKLATLILVLTLAMAARWKGIGAPERWWQRELAALVAVLLLAAVLVSLPPPA